MSSIESMILEIEENYEQILKEFDSRVSTNEQRAFGFKDLSEQDILNLLRQVMSFQRKIEYSKEAILKLYQKTGYTKRLEEICNELLGRFFDEKATFSHVLFEYYTRERYDVRGIIPLLKDTHTKNSWTIVMNTDVLATVLIRVSKC